MLDEFAGIDARSEAVRNRLKTGWDDEQIVGVVTLNGQLHMTYTSQTSIPSLLPAIEQLLRGVCDMEA
jgi:hypothetical protein